MTISEYSFGNWIKRRRKALDITQQELAQRVRCSGSLIFKIESDERRPSRQIAELLAKHLEIPPDEITIFLKVARLEKAVDHLESMPPLSTPQPLAQLGAVSPHVLAWLREVRRSGQRQVRWPSQSNLQDELRG